MQWNRLSRTFVESSFLRIFKNPLKTILCPVLWNDPAWIGRLDQMCHSCPFQTHPFCDCPSPLFSTLCTVITNYQKRHFTQASTFWPCPLRDTILNNQDNRTLKKLSLKKQNLWFTTTETNTGKAYRVGFFMYLHCYSSLTRTYKQPRYGKRRTVQEIPNHQHMKCKSIYIYTMRETGCNSSNFYTFFSAIISRLIQMFSTLTS